MKHMKILASLLFAVVSVQTIAQSTQWAVPETLARPADPMGRYRDFPPLLFDPATGRLLVQLAGTNVQLSLGDVTVTAASTVTNGLAAAGGDAIGDYGCVALSLDGGATYSAPWFTMPLLFNGSTWDRPRGTNGVAAVQLSGTNNTVHVASMPAVTVSQANTEALLNSISNLLYSPIYVGITNATIGDSFANPVYNTNSPMTITQTDTPLYTLGTNSVGGFTAACTNTTTIATNAHTVGMAITSGEITNFFRVNGGSALLQTLTWTQFSQTNTDAKVFWFFSRPITAVTNAALWGPTEADMMFLCASPVYLGCSTNEVMPFGTSGFAQFATGLARPMVNTWTNRELYYVVTQPTVVSAANTSNVVTTARVRVFGLLD